jgi:hypothetical protein
MMNLKARRRMRRATTRATTMKEFLIIMKNQRTYNCQSLQLSVHLLLSLASVQDLQAVQAYDRLLQIRL